jgi:hypothetical protein
MFSIVMFSTKFTFFIGEFLSKSNSKGLSRYITLPFILFTFIISCLTKGYFFFQVFVPNFFRNSSVLGEPSHINLKSFTGFKNLTGTFLLPFFTFCVAIAIFMGFFPEITNIALSFVLDLSL